MWQNVDFLGQIAILLAIKKIRLGVMYYKFIKLNNYEYKKNVFITKKLIIFLKKNDLGDKFINKKNKRLWFCINISRNTKDNQNLIADLNF